MDFLCPNCQKMLTVPDQYAGTLMKCPLCQNTFTAPALPPKPAPLTPAAAMPPPPPPPSETYGVKADAAPPPPPGLTSAPPITNRTAPRPPPAPPSTPTEYAVSYPIRFSPRVLPWVAVGALALVFVLLFFSWVGYYYNYGWTHYGVLTQGAWGAAFGFYGEDKVWEKMTGIEPGQNGYPAPGHNWLLILYLLLFLPTLALAIFSAVLPRMTLKLPPAVEQVRPWRWAVVGALTLASFLVLCLLLFWGFTLEHRTLEAAENKFKDERAAAKTDEDHKIVDLKIAEEVNAK